MLTDSTTAIRLGHVDTVLTLPKSISAHTLADACREAGLAFLNEADHWGKAELAMWLLGPYGQIIQYDVLNDVRSAGAGRPPTLIRDIDARTVERLLRDARAEVRDVLEQMLEADGATSFAFHTLSSGFVRRCEDVNGQIAWTPTINARRLADRVTSLFAADFLMRPGDYELELTVCGLCRSVDFDGTFGTRNVCRRHGHSCFPSGGPFSATIPYLPEVA